jgi:hypothetical protein
MERKESTSLTLELSVEEKESVLRALGFYQIRLFDEMKSKPETDSASRIESQRVTSAIKKIHRSIEPQKNNLNPIV